MPTASATLSDTTDSVDVNDCVSTLISNVPTSDMRMVCGDFNAPLQRDGHRVYNSCCLPTVNANHLVQFVEAIRLILMIGYLILKTKNKTAFL